jgi:hypothetical protein
MTLDVQVKAQQSSQANNNTVAPQMTGTVKAVSREHAVIHTG